MAEKPTSAVDAGRIWEICNELHQRHHAAIAELARTIATDFQSALAQVGIATRERSKDGPGYLNTRPYLLALSYMINSVISDFDIQLGMACLLREPEPDANP